MHERNHDYLTIAEVADRLGVSPSTVRRYIGDGTLPVTQLGGPGSTVRIRAALLEDWLDEHTGVTRSRERSE